MNHAKKKFISLILICTTIFICFGLATPRLWNSNSTTSLPADSIEIKKARPSLHAADSNPKEENLAYFKSFTNNPPKYLQGTTIAGGFRTDEAGGLIIEADNRRLFDYFLTMTGDYTQGEIERIIEGYLEDQLHGSALQDAIQLLKIYMDYINSMASLKESLRYQSYNTSEDFRDLFDQIKSMRLEILGDETASAFFSEQESYESHQISLKELSENPGFSDAERQSFMEEVNIKLPMGQREDREQTFLYVNYQNGAASTTNGGLSKKELDDFRIKTLGEDAAKRLNTVDQERKEWEIKRLAYLDLKTTIEGYSGVAPLEQRTFLESAAKENLALSESEFKRMQALDRINRNH